MDIVTPPSRRTVVNIAIGDVDEPSENPLETLLVLSSLLNNPALGLEQVLLMSVESLGELLDADVGALFLLDPQRDELELRAATGPYAPLRGRRLPKGQGAAGWVVEHGEGLLLDDAKADPRFDGQLDRAAAFPTGSLLCTPVRVRGRVLGALLFARRLGKAGFDPDLPTVARAVAHQLATTVDNERLSGALQATQEALAAANERLAGLDVARRRFVNVASHELLTPITLANGQLEVLQQELGQGDVVGAQQAVSGMREGLARLSRMASHLLSMSLLDDGRIQLALEAVDLDLVLSSVVGAVMPIAMGRDISIDIELRPEPTVIQADTACLEAMLGQLLLNGVRFTPDGGEIVLRIERGTRTVRIDITDTGIGIPHVDQERIFDRMVALGDVLNHHSGQAEFLSAGLGLGLPIARSIAEAHGGRLWVDSAEGKGSSFHCELPVAGPPVGA